MRFRVGLGYDVHQLKPGRPCVLGGVRFDSELGPDGHSDADVLLHAICDALLGAAGLKDIGYYFPNTDDRFKDADSGLLLKEVVRLLESEGFSIGNIDATLVSETPKISPKIDEIKRSIAGLCGISVSSVGVKATTSEKVGFVGRKEGIEAQAIALIYSKE